MNAVCVRLAIVAAIPFSAVAMPGPGAAEDPVAAMGFLAGTWSGPMWGGTFHAYYTTPEGGKVISYNKLMKDGHVAFHEFEVFERDGDTVVFRPYPSGRPATPLKLADCDPAARRVTFENPDKDYPTRIVYHRVADDRLVITLSDPHGGSSKTETFDLQRSR